MLLHVSSISISHKTMLYILRSWGTGCLSTQSKPNKKTEILMKFADKISTRARNNPILPTICWGIVRNRKSSRCFLKKLESVSPAAKRQADKINDTSSRTRSRTQQTKTWTKVSPPQMQTVTTTITGRWKNHFSPKCTKTWQPISRRCWSRLGETRSWRETSQLELTKDRAARVSTCRTMRRTHNVIGIQIWGWRRFHSQADDCSIINHNSTFFLLINQW